MLYEVLSGKRFNDLYTGKKLIKLTNESENHNNYQFQTGLNVDSIPFYPQAECQPGGIYFCSIEKMSMWLDYGYKPMIYARLVTIPDDAQIYTETNKFKAHAFVFTASKHNPQVCSLTYCKA